MELKWEVPKASYTDRRILKTKITGDVMFLAELMNSEFRFWLL